MSRYVIFEADVIRGSAFGPALNIWDSRRGDMFAPTWNRDIHFLDFDTAIIPRMMLVRVDGHPGIGVYRFWGTGVKTYDGADRTNGRVTAQETPEMAEDFAKQYQQVIDTRTPHAFVTEIRLPDPMERRKFEACLRLPFTSDGETVDWMLSIDHYADEWEILLRELGVASLPQPSS